MEIRLKEIAQLVNGRIVGDENILIKGIAPLEDVSENCLSFVSNIKYLKFLYDTQASAVLISEGLVPSHEVKTTLIYVKDSYGAFTRLLEYFNPEMIHRKGIEQPSFISPSVKLDESIYIGAFTYIGERVFLGKNCKIFPQTYLGDDVTIGENTIIYPGVKIYNGVKIGSNCIIHSGCVIGSDGFGFAPMMDGSYKKIPQTGDVIIHDNVEIGANTTIDRATLKSTVIHSGVKLDNLIQVAHNVEIGSNTVIASQTGVSGSTKIGSRCVIAGQVGFTGHISIADGSMIGARSGIAKSITEPNNQWSGAPVNLHKETIRLYILEKNLPEFYRRIQELEKKVNK